MIGGIKSKEGRRKLGLEEREISLCLVEEKGEEGSQNPFRHQTKSVQK